MRFDFWRLPALLGTILLGRPALAQPAIPPAAPSEGVVMMPHDWQIGLQAAHSPVKANIEALNWWVSGLMVLVVVFVAVLLAYTLWRFNHRRHPKASSVSHHTWLEVTWTLAPALILVGIAVPSFKLIYYEDRTRAADMTLKVTGHQWYWQYTYPDQGNIDFVSNILPQDQLKPGQLRLLDVDNRLVLPAGRNIRILTTSADVIHSFFIPSLGVQRYAIPGQTIETWVRIDKPGVYYGECNQICGTNHSAMPIAIQAMNDADFAAWTQMAKTKFSDAGGVAPDRLAALQH